MYLTHHCSVCKSPFFTSTGLKWQQQQLLADLHQLIQYQMEGTYTHMPAMVHQTLGSRIQDCMAPARTLDHHHILSTTCHPGLSSTSMLRLHPLFSTTSGPCPSPIIPLLASQAWVSLFSTFLFLNFRGDIF